jgi:hypothetical protein
LFGASTAMYLDFYNNARFRYTSSPDGLTGLTTALTLDANGATAPAFYTPSDYRIKENVIDLKETDFTVDKLRPVYYDNKKTKKKELGLIAHEVQEAYPFLVTGEKDGDELQSINYVGLISLLVKEIQELKSIIKTLTN